MKISVRDLVRSRQQANSVRASRNDPHHLALVVEGGGMRGVVSGGMVAALEARGLVDCFDSIHGSSAGACAGAYFLAGQASLGTRIYYEDINTRSFIDLWRLFGGKPIMNTSFLIDHVMTKVKPLDVLKILSAKGALHIVGTDANSGSVVDYQNFRDTAHFFSVLRGSITIPVVAGPPVRVDGIELIDGGMVEQIAIRSAMKSGASHILVLLTRKESDLVRPNRTVQRHLEMALIRAIYNKRLADIYRTRDERINETIYLIRHPHGEVVIESIARGPDAANVRRLTTSPTLLMAADDEARRAVFAYLDNGHP
jgi:predicted patatin/cPLA2 family phospholipase